MYLCQAGNTRERMRCGPGSVLARLQRPKAKTRRSWACSASCVNLRNFSLTRDVLRRDVAAFESTRRQKTRNRCPASGCLCLVFHRVNYNHAWICAVLKVVFLPRPHPRSLLAGFDKHGGLQQGVGVPQAGGGVGPGVPDPVRERGESLPRHE